MLNCLSMFSKIMPMLYSVEKMIPKLCPLGCLTTVGSLSIAAYFEKSLFTKALGIELLFTSMTNKYAQSDAQELMSGVLSLAFLGVVFYQRHSIEHHPIGGRILHSLNVTAKVVNSLSVGRFAKSCFKDPYISRLAQLVTTVGLLSLSVHNIKRSL